MDALAVLGNEVAQLRWLACGCGDAVAGVEGRSGKGTAEATRGAGDKPGLFHASSTTRFSYLRNLVVLD